MKKFRDLFWRILGISGFVMFSDALIFTVIYAFAAKNNEVNPFIETNFNYSPYMFGLGFVLMALTVFRGVLLSKKTTASN
ncbi:hypothetical protein [Bacillus toyonensis]|uniref:hypothetical protein n=1 Tax=Bacillus toyonensis TaxID=155322 RepID=UPI002E1D6C7D|nr:hypothetical protein [Bacillus toyonensis]